MKKDKKAILYALVVDDNEVNNIILAYMLELFDIKVEQANDGINAVLMCKEKKYDIIFIDHIMPDMGGVETVNAIRNETLCKEQTKIVILTSNITNNMEDFYNKVNVNDIYIKPLSLLEIALILKKGFPKDNFDTVLRKQEMSENNIKSQYIKEIVKEINEIDYEKGLAYSAGRPVQYIKVLGVSLSDLQSCFNIMVNSFENNSHKQMLIGIHKLKSIFSNIGATELSEKNYMFEKKVLGGRMENINLQYDTYMSELKCFMENLHSLLEKYYMFIKLDVEIKAYKPMTEQEYEQCLKNAIYYIRRYEYDAIVRELERLILQGYPKFMQEYEMSLADIKSYHYENALARMLKIKNETGNLPAQDIDKSI